MPTSSLTGKSKDDLATIATVSGLLTRAQALAMTKPELLKFLKSAETASQAESETQASPASRPSAKGSTRAQPAARKSAARKKMAPDANDSAQPPVPNQEPVLIQSDPAPVQPSKPRRKKTVAQTEEAPAPKTEAPVAIEASEPSEPPVPVAAAAPEQESRQPEPIPADESQPQPQTQPKAQPKAQPQPKSRFAAGQDQRLTDQPEAGSEKAGKPYHRKEKSAARPQPQSRTQQQPAPRSQDRYKKKPAGPGKDRDLANAAAEHKHPLRVKVFGVPANPLANQADEQEATQNHPAPRQNIEELVAVHTPQPLPVEAAPEKHPQGPHKRLEPDQIMPEQAASDMGLPGPDQSESPAMEPFTGDREPANGSAQDKFNRKQQIESGESITGVLEIMPDGYGFLRRDNYLQGAKDAYVPPQYIRRFNLRPGDLITGPCKKQRDNDRYQALLYIKEVNGQTPDKMIRRPHFDRLTPIYPDERYILETARNELSTRIIDLVAPIGKGQRGMIVSPPKAGKTILLQKIANAISTNNPDVKLIVLLIDERPEEVTDMQRSINGEVVFSTFDKTPENHVKVTELVLERAMRLVELKQDVVILLDSMTRLARAYNLTITPTGRTLSGGLDPGALYGPKRFFGAARNIENGGSLTIIATSLIETGSRMDEVIFEEFKGTGNMEVYLDRKLSEKRIFPAIDINRSGTRREELLLTDKELDAVWTIRKAFGQLDTAAVTETIINLLLKTQNNQQFISSINVSFNDKNVFEAMRGSRPSQSNGNAPSSGGSGNNRRNYERDND